MTSTVEQLNLFFPTNLYTFSFELQNHGSTVQYSCQETQRANSRLHLIFYPPFLPQQTIPSWHLSADAAWSCGRRPAAARGGGQAGGQGCWAASQAAWHVLVADARSKPRSEHGNHMGTIQSWASHGAKNTRSSAWWGGEDPVSVTLLFGIRGLGSWEIFWRYSAAMMFSCIKRY